MNRLTEENEGGFSSHYFQQRIDGPSFSALFIGDRLRRILSESRGNGSASRARRSCTGGVSAPGRSTPPWPLGSNCWGIGWSRLSDSSAGSAWITSCTMAIPGRSRSTPVTRPRSRFTSWPLADRCWRCIAEPARETRIKTNDWQRADSPRPRMIAKLTLYAQQRLIAPEIVADDNEPDGPFAVQIDRRRPWPGTRFERGDPVMTILAAGEDLTSCHERLGRLERKWRRRLGLRTDEPSNG